MAASSGQVRVIVPELIANAKELRQKMTKAERKLWSKIRNKQLGFKFRRQVVFGDRYIVDFACFEEKLILEIDGGQHCDSLQDKLRDEYLTVQGYRVLRFWNNQVLSNIEGVIGRLRKSPPP
jgi:very-short-patch-repair endonuclease